MNRFLDLDDARMPQTPDRIVSMLTSMFRVMNRFLDLDDAWMPQT